MIIDFLKKEDESSWDDFVNKNRDATFFHTLGWKRLVEKVYKNRFESKYLIAKENRMCRGILPLFLCKDWLKGKRLISIPFATAGGTCVESESAEKILIEKAIKLTKDLNADYLELRNLKQKKGDWVTKDNFFTLILDLDSDPDKLWSSFRATSRRYIRRAIENDLDVITASNDIETFYEIFSRGQLNLGTPVLSYAWVKNLFFNFTNQHTIAKVCYKNKTIAALFLRKFKDTIYYVLGASLLEYRHLYPNYILFWKLIQESCKEGYKQFDFGRSVASSGSYFFKIGWGARPQQYHYQYHLNKVKSIQNTSQDNPNRKRFAKVWKKLPLRVANALGPMIRKYYP